MSDISYHCDGACNGNSSGAFENSSRGLQSLDHLPDVADDLAPQSMLRHSSTSNVLTACSDSQQERSLGTLQRLARSSTNLISRSKSCLTLESLQRFRKNFLRSHRSGTSVEVNGSDTANRKTAVSPDTESSTAAEARLCSPSPSIQSIDISDIPDRLGSTEDPLTTSSNLTLSSTSRIEPLLSDNKLSLQDEDNHQGTSSFLQNVPKNNIDELDKLKNKKSSASTQRSKSFHAESSKRSIRRNPSMLYYFNKGPLRLRFSKGAKSGDSGRRSLKEVDYENLMNKSNSCELPKSNNIISMNESLNTNEHISEDIPSSVFDNTNHSEKPVRLNISKSYQNFSDSSNLSHSNLTGTENFGLADQSLSNICDPSQFHGPEFVIRSRQLPKQLTLFQEKHNHSSALKKGVTVVLVNGQRLIIQCSPLNTCLSHLMQCVSSECGVPGNLQAVFGLALLQDGQFIFPPHHTCLFKIAPKGWKNKKISKDGSCETFTLYYRLAYYHRGIESHSRVLCYLVYLQLRQDMLEGRLHTASPQQLLYLASLALRAEMSDWLLLYQEVSHVILKYYLPEFLLSKLQDETMSSEEQEPTSPSIREGNADALVSEDNDGSDTLSAAEIVRVLNSYESKLRTVSVWGAIKRYISTAQHTLYYGAHYYALLQHPQVGHRIS